MKKLFVAIIALSVSLGAFAQTGQGTHAREAGQPKHQMGSRQGHEKFEAEKVAFITEQLDLSAEEAQKFWPVYNGVQKELRAGFDVMRQKKHALRDAVKAGKSDSEIKPLLDDWINTCKENKDPMLEHRADFVKVIGEAKTAKLYLAEEGFRNRAIRRMVDGDRDGKRPDVQKPGAKRPGVQNPERHQK